MRAAIAGAVVLTGAAIGQLHYVREGAGGQVLWNAEEAYFFIGVSYDGLRIRYLEYPWFLIKEAFHASYLRDTTRGSMMVVRITKSGVERHMVALDLPTPAPHLFTPHDGKIYANCAQLGGLCKWSGDHFERAVEEERRGFSFEHLHADIERNGEDGWWQRGFGGCDDRDDNVGDRFRISTRMGGTRQSLVCTLRIDRVNAAGGAEPIWEFKGREGRISGSEYRRIFH